MCIRDSAVTVRESEKRDIGWPVSDFGELTSQGPGRSIAVAARPDGDAYPTRRNLRVGDDADVPEERTFGVRHEIARVGEIRVADLLLRQPVRRWLAADQHAAIEDIQPNRRHGLSALGEQADETCGHDEKRAHHSSFGRPFCSTSQTRARSGPYCPTLTGEENLAELATFLADSEGHLTERVAS